MSRRRPATVQRCPACGQHFQPPAPSKCTLCGYNLDFGIEPATGDDATPYARAFAHEQPGWRRMAEWVWFAQWGRLKHLAMMRASAASRRFALVNTMLLALSMGMVQATQLGWRWVTASPASEPTGSIEPAGKGWLHLVSTARPLPPEFPPEKPVDLWWNPPQTVIAFAVGLILAIILLWVGLALARRLVTWAHTDPYRREQRMEAAIHYSTAWTLPLLAATLILALRPFAYAGRIAGWGWYPRQSVILVAAGVFASFGLAMWWFWLGRLGTTAPAATRARVTACLAGLLPALAGGLCVLWWFGVAWFCAAVFEKIGLDF